MDLDLPPLDQIGLVVRDMDAALRTYEPLFGPFGVFELPIVGADYRGRRCDCRVRIALGRSGSLEIELIELLEGDALYAELLESGREGLHHMRSSVEALEPVLDACRQIGFVAVFSGDLDPIPVRFAYLEGPDGTLLELVEYSHTS